MRAIVPYELGNWACMWTKSHPNYQLSSWMMEIDIFEVMGKLNNFSSSIHKWCTDGNASIPGDWSDRTYTFKKADIPGYHTYGFEWTPEEISFYCDGNKFYTFEIREENDYGEDELSGLEGFHDPAYLILTNHLFIKDVTWWIPDPVSINAVNDRMPFPKTMQIDYVRLYQKPGVGEVLTPQANRFP